MNENENEIERGSTLFEKLFYFFLLPVAFFFVLSVIVIFFLGERVTQPMMNIGQQIPIVSGWLQEEEVMEEEDILEQLEQDLQQSMADATSQEREIQRLLTELESTREEADLLRQQVESQIIEEEQFAELEEERQIRYQELARLYTQMSASRAAAILEELTRHESALIIRHMGVDDQAQMLARMEPQVASEITVILKNTQRLQDLEEMADQERSERLARYNFLTEDGLPIDPRLSEQQLADTFNQMPAGAAVTILEEMATEDLESFDFQLGLRILALVSDERRSQLLGQMNGQVASRYLQELSS